MKGAYAPQRSFRHFLKEQLASRCARNPHYSLRAFANYLGVNHSTLSQMLRGKRTLTPEAIAKFGNRLGLSENDIHDWIEVERHQPNEAPAERLLTSSPAAAEMLADGLGFALLELLRLPDFQPDSRWIARMLGVSLDEVNLTLSRLCRLGFLRMKSPAEWEDCFGNAVFETPASGFSTVTLAIPASHVKEALARIARFRSEFIAWLESAPEKDEVYRLDIQFLPVTRPPDTKEN